MTQFIGVKKITHISTTEHSKNIKQEMNNRPYYGISLAIEGKIVYKHKGNQFVSDSQHIIILPKNQSYTLECTESGSFTLVNFLLNEDVELDTFLVIETKNADRFLTVYKKLKAASFLRNESQYAKMMSYFYELLAIILDEQQSNNAPLVLRNALTLIEQNIDNPKLSNLWLASKLYISEVYLRKLFSSHLKFSPKQYIKNIRLEKAKDLLTYSADSVSYVSEKCGYSDCSLFCRAFKSRFGITPTEFRKENQTFYM